MTFWLNGRLLEDGTAAIDPGDRGFTLGDGLFETIRASGGSACHLDRHFARLRRGAAVLDLPVPWADEAIAEAIAEVLAANRLTDAAIRVTLSRGPGARGVPPPAQPTPTLLITAAAAAPAGPAVAIIATVTRRNQASPLSQIKSLNYLDNILARLEAARLGANEALLLNTVGRVVESSAANLFVVLDGVLTTPPIEDGPLPGIMRGLLIERCGAVERSLTPDLLFAAESAFLSSSLGLRPLVMVNGRRIGGLGAGAAVVAGLGPVVLAP